MTKRDSFSENHYFGEDENGNATIVHKSTDTVVGTFTETGLQIGDISTSSINSEEGYFTLSHVGKLSVGGVQYHPPQTVLDDSPPSDGTTQTFDLRSELINNFGIGMYRVEFRAKHTQDGWTGSRTWWGDIWYNVGYQGSPATSEVTSINREIVAPQSTGGTNMTLALSEGVVSYSTTFNYAPNLIIRIVNIS